MKSEPDDDNPLPTAFRFYRIVWQGGCTIGRDGKINKQAKIKYYWWAWPIILPQVLYYRIMRVFEREKKA